MRVRPAGPAECDSIISVLDAAMLRTDSETTAAAIADDRAFVAVAGGRLLGTAVCLSRERGVHADAIAVRPGRRGQGIGSALLSAVTDRYRRVTARFDPGVRRFYEKQGWSVERVEDDRYRAVFER